MTTRILLAAAILAATSAAPGADDPSKKLAEALKGKWQLTARVANGVETDADFVKNRTMVVGDGKYTVYDGEDEYLTAAFRVDATQKPHHFDVPEKDLNQFGVVKLEGDVLTICIGPSDGTRATAFESPKEKDWILVTYKRVK